MKTVFVWGKDRCADSYVYQHVCTCVETHAEVKGYPCGVILQEPPTGLCETRSLTGA